MLEQCAQRVAKGRDALLPAYCTLCEVIQARANLTPPSSPSLNSLLFHGFSAPAFLPLLSIPASAEKPQEGRPLERGGKGGEEGKERERLRGKNVRRGEGGGVLRKWEEGRGWEKCWA